MLRSGALVPCHAHALAVHSRWQSRSPAAKTRRVAGAVQHTSAVASLLTPSHGSAVLVSGSETVFWLTWAELSFTSDTGRASTKDVGALKLAHSRRDLDPQS